MFSRITTVGVVLGMAAVSRDGPFKFLYLCYWHVKDQSTLAILLWLSQLLRCNFWWCLFKYYVYRLSRDCDVKHHLIWFDLLRLSLCGILYGMNCRAVWRCVMYGCCFVKPYQCYSEVISRDIRRHTRENFGVMAVNSLSCRLQSSAG